MTSENHLHFTLQKDSSADGLEVLAVEPNISEHAEFDVVNCKDAIAQADVVTFLVGHKEFRDLDLSTELDFCGVLNK